jgi:HAE1 family hydrophobic/amphiphilic exporter-1
MTSFTTIFGLLPIALGIGEGAETLTPLAIAVIGGLFTSTFLTLLVVPCVYTVVDDISRRKFPPEEKSEGSS